MSCNSARLAKKKKKKHIFLGKLELFQIKQRRKLKQKNQNEIIQSTELVFCKRLRNRRLILETLIFDWI